MATLIRAYRRLLFRLWNDRMRDPREHPEMHLLFYLPDYDELTVEHVPGGEVIREHNGRELARRSALLDAAGVPIDNKIAWRASGRLLEIGDVSGRPPHPFWQYRNASFACELELDSVDEPTHGRT